MTSPAEGLPDWITWRQRPFPDANLLLLPGSQSALVDTGFVGHAQDTADWVRAQTRDLALVVNTHWHSDHVGANGLLQSGGACVAASGIDAEAVNRRDPGCCVAEYLDQPVAPYTVDETLDDGQVLRLGDAEWQGSSRSSSMSSHTGSPCGAARATASLAAIRRASMASYNRE